ncbi:MAG: hypothetical protein DRH15_13730 [Deltaproteobacteria bacterium]|nr:MAG: hypothetical protein DRH15_13730 [Deltaproteobacteria bacterium]
MPMISELRSLLQNVKAIVFDFDGTLVYPINADWDRAKKKINKLMIKKKITLVEIDAPYLVRIVETAKKLGDKKSLEFVKKAYKFLEEEELKTLSSLKATTDLELLLEKIIKNNKKIGIFSVNSREFLRRAIDILKINKYISALVSRDDITNPKPHPDGILLVCKKLNVVPKFCIMIGDSPQDILAAKKAGARTIAVLTGRKKYRDKLLKIKPDFIIESIDILQNVFNG